VQIDIGNVEALGAPLGAYSHVARVRGAQETLHLAGMLAAGDTFEAQCDGVFAAIQATLLSRGAGWPNVVQFTTYLTDPEDIPRFMAWRRPAFARFFPDGAFPPNTLVVVAGLVGPEYRIEVQTLAAR